MQRILLRLRQEYPGFWKKIHGSAYQSAGLPDIIGSYRGRFVGFEVKMPGKKATPKQEHTLGEITLAGGIAQVISSYDEAQVALETAVERG